MEVRARMCPPLKISSRQFAVFRVVFGTYLAIHFAHLIPYGAELFSCRGMLPEPRVNFTSTIFPNPLATWDSPAAVTVFLCLLTTASVAYALGLWRRTTSLLLWFGWACLFNRNNLISNPSLPYVGLMLLLSALIPPGEEWSLSRRNPEWSFPATIYWTAWWLLAFGYTFSGYTKLLSPSWLDGTALAHVLNNPLARPGTVRDWLLQRPAGILAFATWATVVAELLFVPLSLTLQTRFVAWATMVALHVGITFLVQFADLSLGMLLVHLLTFDPRWMQSCRGACDKRLILFRRLTQRPLRSTY